jgi:hypothetical protein
MKKFKEAHSANKKFGMGDYYGTGVKNPTGKMRDNYMNDQLIKPKTLKKAPRSLA